MTRTPHLEYDFRVSDGETVDQAIKRANRDLDAQGKNPGRAVVNRKIRQMWREDLRAQAARTSRPAIEAGPYFLSAADPTGETAIKNVMASKKKGPSAAVSPACAPRPASQPNYQKDATS